MTFYNNAPDLDHRVPVRHCLSRGRRFLAEESLLCATVDVARERDLFVSVQDSLIDVAADHGFQKHSCKFIRGFLHTSRFLR